ncbi:ParM/StbA family protein (plasmid) [Bacillus halotolerans]|uniref:ParM/StbA family protein n=1 Tax=Bacillus halotolerans TaxID=260554 RepID=A0A9Q4HRZ5_9BACI|nr:ParM/StbA family protein [Bacillus halotolerans]MCY9186566.1 ParM/StbA family protein [Bacillus halotolerans]WAT23536.1 ParM/StbA family protein [Bacillus halotolerans]
MTTKTSKKEKVSMPYLVAVDIGFGELKRISSAFPEAIAIPSAVVPGAKPAGNKLIDHETIKDESLIVTTSEGTYYVGEHAMKIPTSGSKRTKIRDRASDHLSRVLFQTGIALGVPHETGEYDVAVVTGLPNEDFDLTIKDRLEEFLNKPFTVEFHLSANHSITKTINITSVDIIRQPEGSVTYNQFEFDKVEFLVPSEDAKAIVGIIDFGHFTTDYALFQDGVIIEDDTTNGSTIGVTDAYNKLKRKLIVKFDRMGYEYRASDRDLDKAIRTGYVHYMGEEIDVKAEVESCAEEVAATIAKEVLDAWGNETNRLELIVISGGGSHVFSKFIQTEFETRNKQGFQVLDAPQFSNVLGFYMYGCISLSDTFDEEKVYDKYVTPVFGRVA